MRASWIIAVDGPGSVMARPGRPPETSRSAVGRGPGPRGLTHSSTGPTLWKRLANNRMTRKIADIERTPRQKVTILRAVGSNGTMTNDNKASGRIARDAANDKDQPSSFPSPSDRPAAIYRIPKTDRATPKRDTAVPNRNTKPERKRVVPSTTAPIERMRRPFGRLLKQLHRVGLMASSHLKIDGPE